MSGGNGLGQKQRVAILAAGFIKGESGVGSKFLVTANV
jgi:hypothetical protein